MKTVMVTGSQGYIGSNLCRLLIEQGYNVVQIDKKIGSDILETELWLYDVDYIVHLAAIASIGECEINTCQTIRDNVLTCQTISQYAKDLDIPVFFSSSQAIKNPKSSVYAMTKLIGEETFKTNNDYIIMRFANVFGGINFVEDKTSVVAKWIRNYRKGLPLIINGTGAQTRDFVHVDSICRTIIRCIEINIINEVFDIGTGKETSINELFKLFPDNAICEYDSNSDMVGVTSNVAELGGVDIVESISIDGYLKDFFN